MRRVLALLVPFLLLVPAAEAHDLGPFSVGHPGYIIYLLDNFTTPDLAPGESGPMELTVKNPYPAPWEIENVSLRFEVCRYRQLDKDLRIDASWPHAMPAFRDGSSGATNPLFWEPTVPPLSSGEALNVSATVLTDTAIPHGSLTNQGSYFFRTRMEFDLTNGTVNHHSVMMSMSYFTEEQFATSRLKQGEACPSGMYCEGGLNLTYLGSVYGLEHIDALLPETGFSLKDPMPGWVFGVLGVMTGGFLVLALLFYAEENPGKYPRIARWWLSMKGKVRGVVPPRKRAK